MLQHAGCLLRFHPRTSVSLPTASPRSMIIVFYSIIWWDIYLKVCISAKKWVQTDSCRVLPGNGRVRGIVCLLCLRRHWTQRPKSLAPSSDRGTFNGTAVPSSQTACATRDRFIPDRGIVSVPFPGPLKPDVLSEGRTSSLKGTYGPFLTSLKDSLTEGSVSRLPLTVM